MQKHVKAMTELFNEFSVIGAPIEEEDKVVTLLASLPDSCNMLVTALEANAEVPSMEVVTKRLIHEDRKANERDTALSKKLFLWRKSKKRDRSVTTVVNSAILYVTATNLTRIEIPRNPSQKKHKANSAQDDMESDSPCYSGFDSGCA